MYKKSWQVSKYIKPSHVKNRREGLFGLDFLEMKYFRSIKVVRNLIRTTKYVLSKLGGKRFNFLNTLRTGDADLRHLRFCVTTVKNG
jgi:hypothetical protein